MGEALTKYLEGLPEPDKVRSQGLLTALAYARGGGINDQQWLTCAAALGYPATVMDLDQLRASTAADYLLQTVPGNGGAVTRLFHQALTDELLTHRPDQRGDEQRLFDSLRGQASAAGGWAQAGDYPRRHAAEHAAAAGQLPILLKDSHYLAVADFPRLLAVLAEASAKLASNATAIVVRQVGVRAAPLPPARRARLLALTAAHLGLSNTRRELATACTDGIVPKWAHSLGVPHRELVRWPGE